MKYLLSVLFCLFLFLNTNGEKHYSFDAECQNAYKHILALRFEEGKAVLDQVKKEQPNNLIPYYLENYIDFFQITIDLDKELLDSRRDNEDFRLDLMEEGPSTSPWHLQTQAEILVHWAFIKVQHKEYLSSAWAVRKAFQHLKENLKRHPKFIPSLKTMGMLQVIIGNIPEDYRWVANLLGMDGTIAEGLDKLSGILDNPKISQAPIYDETLSLYALCALYFGNDKSGTWEIVEKNRNKLKDNLLNHFSFGVIAMRTGHNDEAIEMLLNRPRGAAYYPFEYLDFMLGVAKLRKGDEDAVKYLTQFVDAYKGKNRFIYEGYQKLAWYYLIRGDKKSYNSWISKCKDGESVAGGDQQAIKEYETGIVPHKDILKARLMFDGSYYQEASTIMESIDPASLKSKKEQLEYQYRKGRIYHEWGKHDEAILAYQKAMIDGADYKYYYGANSALKLGELYESLASYEEAEETFKACLKMNPNEYKHSINVQAKAGLNRVKGKIKIEE